MDYQNGGWIFGHEIEQMQDFCKRSSDYWTINVEATRLTGCSQLDIFLDQTFMDFEWVAREFVDFECRHSGDLTVLPFMTGALMDLQQSPANLPK